MTTDRYPVTHDPHDPETAHMVIRPSPPPKPPPPPRKPSRWAAIRSWAIGIPLLLLASVGAILTRQPDVVPTAPPPLEWLNPTERALAADYVTTVRVERAAYRVTVLAGFETDGASIPEAARGLLGLGPFHPAIVRAAVVHDALYRSQLVSREIADRIFLAAMLEDGVEERKAEACYRAVVAAGAGAMRAGYSSERVEAARKLVSVDRL